MTTGPGAVVAGRYEILDRIAEGGMSTVYRARRRPDGLIVALKVLREPYAADREFVERFTREARAAEALQHPNIVRVYESGRDGETYFIAMEYVDGTDLKGHLRRVGRLAGDDAERVAAAVCEALEYAHHEGIVHRDVKPQNILIAADGTVKVADFGIARAVSAVTITHPGTVLGTVQYLAPEQARGAPVGRASDIYSLGAVLYEMLTGRLPFDGDTPIAIALKHLREPPPRPRALQPDVPVRLEGIVLKAMAKRPDDRYRSARDMAEDLTGRAERWRDVIEEEDAVTRQFDLPLDGHRAHRRRVLARVAVIVVAALVVAGWVAWRSVEAYLTVPEVEMPELVGRPLAAAEVLAREAGLVVEVADRVNSSTVPADVVVAQDQPPGKRLKQGRRVAVTVSLGLRLVTVPNLIQRPLQDAQLALDAAQLKVGALQDGYDDLVRPGVVMRQNPAAGAQVPADTAVTLVISRGPPQVEMPEVVGRRLDDARRVLEERNLVVAHVRTIGSEVAAPGTVLEQTPAAGTRVRPDQVVITLAVAARPGEETAPPQVPVITAEPQPVATPRPPTPGPPRPTPTSGLSQPTQPTPRPTPAAGQVRRTRVQVVVPEGGVQEVKIVVIDETGVHTAYQAPHVPGDRVDQVVPSRGYTIIQVYVASRLVQEIRP
jgi:beta-lactam-binding protein with PASTA domain/tRNA A-37 threonylcarbamoyl transferase component Bud32